MAKEISVTMTLRWARQGVAIQASATDTYDQIGVEAIENVQKIGNVSEPLVLGDVLIPQYMFFKNLSRTPVDPLITTFDVYVGHTDPVTAQNATLILKPGKGAFLASQQLNWFGISGGATEAELLVIAIQK